ncbi:MAG: hypothetical protein RI906_276 [Pseudomonadota bacterium]|jgi:hypothetical protein
MRPDPVVADQPKRAEVSGRYAPGTARAGFFATLRAVAWSFFGVRARKAHEADMVSLNPIHVVIVGIALAALFVLTLIGVVRLVVA